RGGGRERVGPVREQDRGLAGGKPREQREEAIARVLLEAILEPDEVDADVADRDRRDLVAQKPPRGETCECVRDAVRAGESIVVAEDREHAVRRADTGELGYPCVELGGRRV